MYPIQWIHPEQSCKTEQSCITHAGHLEEKGDNHRLSDKGLLWGLEGSS